MSDTESPSNAKDAKSTNMLKDRYTARELNVMSYALLAAKGSLPEIDYAKLAEIAGMTNNKSAYNAWSALKKKLLADRGTDGAEATAGEAGDSPGTPAGKTKKGRGRPKKSPAKIVDGEEADADAGDDGDGEDTPKKAVKKSTPKKRGAAKEGEGSAKKKTKKSKDAGERADSGAEDIAAADKATVKKLDKEIKKKSRKVKKDDTAEHDVDEEEAKTEKEFDIKDYKFPKKENDKDAAKAVQNEGDAAQDGTEEGSELTKEHKMEDEQIDEAEV